MKRPGPRSSRVVSKIIAYHLLLSWLGLRDERLEGVLEFLKSVAVVTENK